MKLSPAHSPVVYPSVRPQVSLPIVTPSTSLGFYVILLYLFDVFARLPEFSVMLLGTAFLQTPILAIISLCLALVSGHILEGFQLPTGRWLFAFILWVSISLPFSFWKSASASSFNIMIRQYLLFLLIVALVRSADQVRKAIVCVGFVPVPILLAILTMGMEDDGRLQLGLGSFANSNELAGYLVMLAPLSLLVASMRRYNWAVRGAGFFMSVSCVALASRTGSRGALISIIIVLFLLFWSYSFAGKIKLAVITVPIAAGLILAVPEEARVRYTTTFKEKVDMQGTAGFLQQSAINSTATRIELFKQSVRLTVENPVFGVGLGTFVAAAAAQSQDEGKRALWQVTHNAYTQISSETGIPSLIFYLGACWSIVAGLVKLKRKARSALTPAVEDVVLLANHLMLAFVAFGIHGLFTSTAGSFNFFILAGLAVALTRAGVADNESAAEPKPAVAAASLTPVAASALEPEPGPKRYPPVRRLPRPARPAQYIPKR